MSGYYYDITPGNRVSEEKAQHLDEWIRTACQGRAEALLFKNDRGQIIQRVYFEREDDKNLFALYVAGQNLAEKSSNK